MVFFAAYVFNVVVAPAVISGVMLGPAKGPHARFFTKKWSFG